MPETGVECKQHIAHGHPAFRGGVGSVIDGGKRGLGTGTGVHGVQVVDKALHRLIGILVGPLQGPAAHTLHKMRHDICRDPHAL